MTTGGDSDGGPTAGLIIGCFGAVCIIIFSIVSLIWEIFKPDKFNKVNCDPGEPNLHRKNRFNDTITGVTEKKFKKSQYLYYYDRSDKCPSNDAVINSLLGLQVIKDRSHPLFQLIQSENPEHNVLKAYSSNETFGSTAFFRYVNRQLRKDNGTTLEKLMPFIRRATKQINDNGPSQSCIVYRGMVLKPEERDYFTVGKIFRFPGFTSTSTIRDNARYFGDTLFEIRIPAGCLQVRDIATISCFTYEEEWLFSPYSLFQVKEKRHDVIVLQSIDNMAEV